MRFEYLKRYRKILVTGPHRSRTTIAATMIAHDTGHGLIREELCHFKAEGVRHWINDVDAPIVVQAPFVADICHTFPNVLVVFMQRDIGEILDSQDRMKLPNGKPVNWATMELKERAKYHSLHEKTNIAAVKYENWQEQKKRLPYTLELGVDDLKEHSMWIDERSNWHVRQTDAVA